MSDVERQQILSDEASTELQYRESLRKRAQRRGPNEIDRNTWTAGQHRELDLPKDGWIVARVALDGPSDTISGAKDFYIGSNHLEVNGTDVFSWAAPVSCTFYRKSTFHHELCDHVVGVRTFAHDGDRIVAFEDEAITQSTAEPLFDRRTLSIPRAPGRSATASKPAVDASPGPTEAILRPASDALKALKPLPGPPLRASAILQYQLAAPKKVAMAAVLATLQPDQYELISQPYSANEFLQGHPGTGKTIIAVHRAAFLLNPWAPPETRIPPGGRVLIVGPTDEFKTHISSALRGLVDEPNRYIVMSMPEILDRLAQLPSSGESTRASSYLDVDNRLARLIDRAYARARGRVSDGGRASRSDTYAALLGFLIDPPEGTLDAEWVTYLRALPRSYAEIHSLRRADHRALLAYIGSRVDRPSGPFANLKHVIVDEAQDVHPLEWFTLGRIGNGGGWTVLGDLNQRRTDVTFSSWDPIAEALGIEEDGKAPVTVLNRGYRSTTEIMQFANQLLKREDRGLVSLQQDGTPPRRIRADVSTELYPTAVRAAIELSARLVGSVALISMQPQELTRILQRHGWVAAAGDLSTWSRIDDILRVLAPDRARGLEFDGVVVVEPAAFPINYGRQGVLYTALTRANRELVVVSHQALPKELHR